MESLLKYIDAKYVPWYRLVLSGDDADEHANVNLEYLSDEDSTEEAVV